MKIVELLSKGMRLVRDALRIHTPAKAPTAALAASADADAAANTTANTAADTSADAPLVAAPNEVAPQPDLAAISPAVPENDVSVPVAAPAPVASPAGGGAVIAKEPGLSCPRCLHRIQVSISMLLSGSPVICTRCFLHLAVDRERSKDSLAALATLEGQLETARRMTQR